VCVCVRCVVLCVLCVLCVVYVVCCGVYGVFCVVCGTCAVCIPFGLYSFLHKAFFFKKKNSVINEYFHSKRFE
jgi:hypothetical protein